MAEAIRNIRKNKIATCQITPIRLHHSAYQGHRYYFITICAFESKNYFSNNMIADSVIVKIKTVFPTKRILVHAWCLMPNHLHILISSAEDVNIIEAISSFKQTTGFGAKRKFNIQLWQKRFYDHILCKDEDIGKVVRYIFENPIRKGFVKALIDYPYLGSLTFEINPSQNFKQPRAYKMI